jgi:3-oxoacyl-[acyl-carrier-protein] synthase II
MRSSPTPPSSARPVRWPVVAVCALAAVLAVHHGVIPPTINLENVDPGCAALGLNFTPNTAVKKRVDYALANSFGFGGTNASLVVGRV